MNGASAIAQPIRLGKLLVTNATNMTVTCPLPQDTEERGEWITVFALRKPTGLEGQTGTEISGR